MKEVVVSIVLALLGASGGGVIGAWLNHRRESRKNYDQVALDVYTKVADEQDRWRRHLQEQLSRQEQQIGALRVENAQLYRRIAELEAHNTDLKRDNEELETRVMELEKELKGYRGMKQVG